MDSVEFNVQLAPFAINAISKRKLPCQTPDQDQVFITLNIIIKHKISFFPNVNCTFSFSLIILRPVDRL